MFSYFEQHLIENSFGKVLFKFWPKSKWREIKIGYLAAILKRYNILIFCFCGIMILYSAYIYGANFIAKFRWESGFLRGVPWNLLGHQWEWKYLGHLSVNQPMVTTPAREPHTASIPFLTHTLNTHITLSSLSCVYKRFLTKAQCMHGLSIS